MYGLVGAEQAGRLSVPAVLLRLGNASYSIYLTHLIAIMCMQQVLQAVRGVVTVPVDLRFRVADIGCGHGRNRVSELIEQPVLRRLRPRTRLLADAGARLDESRVDLRHVA